MKLLKPNPVLSYRHDDNFFLLTYIVYSLTLFIFALCITPQ